jgi:hypothetical protein
VRFPDRVGLFVGPHAFWLGARAGGDLAGTVELLGPWAFPVFLVLGVGGIAASIYALRAMARWRLGRLRRAGAGPITF